MPIVLLVITLIAVAAIATFVVVSPTVPHWVKLLFNIGLGIAVIAGICFGIYVISGIVTHI